jgi:hypothetical protein
MNIGPFGADVIMTRRHCDPGPRLHRQAMYISASVAIVLVATANARET